MNELKKWIDEYVEKFDEPFPAFELAGTTEEKKIKIIKQAIEENAPIEIEYEEDVLY